MTYSQPSSLSDALGVLEGARATIVAGGTDYYPAMSGHRQPDVLLDVSRIDGLSDVSFCKETIRIGAAVTWTDIIKADLPRAFDALKQAAKEVGSIQIQNAGTVVGNICNASPAADGIPPLLALDARVELVSAARGLRVVAMQDFVTGVRQTARAPDELVTSLIVAKPPSAMVSGFEKLGSRTYLVISIVMTAANLLLDQAGRIAQARIAVGSCSSVAQRLPDLENDLIGKAPGAFKISDQHLAPLNPIDDVRGSSVYRLEAARQQINRVLSRARA
ncbi:MAG: FAD binding domain-containing protein [Pseudomonadota bacterium]